MNVDQKYYVKNEIEDQLTITIRAKFIVFNYNKKKKLKKVKKIKYLRNNFLILNFQKKNLLILSNFK